MNKTTISKILIVLSLLVSLSLTICSCDFSGLPFAHTCEDADKNHVCDNGCEEILGTCEDADKDHACDYGCAKVFGTCEDADKDHDCDYGCVKVFGTCEDADKDHDCDYGCVKVFGTCEDADKDHACDYGCAKVFGTCEDADKDHDCDYGCAKVFGTCEDANKDHACDYGCTKTFGDHADGDDKDHLCDYGCGKVADDGCYDTVVDGKCDECGIDFDHNCVDTNKDHKCDYGCAKVHGTCEDADKDHDCDYGCTKVFGTCEDANKDHKCDYGCTKVYGTCEDANKDHKCDYGCTKVYGTCEDANKDHACDYGCTKTFGDHADGDDKDHLCDYGCKELADDGCYDTKVDGKCDECGELTPIFVMFNNDHTAKVTVPAGETHYFQAYGLSSNIVLTANGEAVDVVFAMNPRMPSTFNITNSTDTDVEYTLVLNYPVGSYENPEILFRPNYIVVNVPAGNDQGYYYKWTTMDNGTLVLTCPTIEGVEYDVVLTNMSNYAMAWLSDSTDGTVSIEVKAGDEIVIQVVVAPNANWEYPALETAITGEFVFPIGHQQNPEILFRPNYIVVNVPAGNDQGYYYKWTTMDNGTLVLACPTIEGVEYDVVLTNMSNYAMAWLSDSTDGTVSIEVKAGDEIVIQVVVAPNANWEYPALEVALTGAFNYAIGHQQNPEVIEELDWYYGDVSQPEGESQGYFYTYTAPADGTIVFYFNTYSCTPEGFVGDIVLYNLTTYVQKTLLEDGVDNYGMEVSMDVKAGDVISISVIAVQDAEGNYYPAADLSWCGNFTYPAGSEKNPIYVEWQWDDEYANAAATVTVEAGKTVYFTGNAKMILTVNGVETEMNLEGAFAITNDGEAAAEYALALATPVGAYSNPEVIEDAINFSDSKSLDADGSYYYIWTATEDTTLVLDITDGANVTVDVLTYVEDSEWPISEQFALAEPETDENWNYTGWIVAENLTIEVLAGQEVKIQINGLTDWATWTVPAVDYTLTIVEAAAE